MPAPKGNQNAVGNEGGRPPIHTDPEHVGTLVKDYFDWIQGEFKNEDYIDEEGNARTRKVWTRPPENPTVTGLALHLGFCSKSTLYDYSEKVEFSHYIKSGLLRIEKFHETQASYGEKCTGNIFILKNFGWKDTQAMDLTTQGDKIQPPVIAFKKIDE